MKQQASYFLSKDGSNQRNLRMPHLELESMDYLYKKSRWCHHLEKQLWKQGTKIKFQLIQKVAKDKLHQLFVKTFQKIFQVCIVKEACNKISKEGGLDNQVCIVRVRENYVSINLDKRWQRRKKKYSHASFLLVIY